MIEVIYREDVSEDTIHEPRNVKQIGSVDPKYRIYMEETVLACIRNSTAEENEVNFGVLLGELKRAAGTTYLFIRGMVKAAEKKKEVHGSQPGEKETAASAGWPRGAQKQEFLKDKSDRKGVEERKSERGTGSGAVALERLALDRQREAENEEERRAPQEDGHAEGNEEYRQEPQESGHAPEKEEDRWSLREDSGLTGSAAESETAGCPLIEFDGETWTKLYEDINCYFPDMEILGWYASFAFLNVAEFDLCRQIHYTHFSGADKVLFLCDRTEREENFYRPDGAELRETEGYFTFFEKNDAMLSWQQENEVQIGEKEKTQSDGVRQAGARQGTVGEAPRRKWSISAASVLVTAALLAAVLVLNRYNSRLKMEDLSTAGETGGEGTSEVQLLAVDGQVMGEIMNREGTGSGNSDGEGADGENSGSDGKCGK